MNIITNKTLETLKYDLVREGLVQYEVVEQMLIYSMDNLCDEIVEFIASLYKCTDTQKERDILTDMIKDIP